MSANRHIVLLLDTTNPHHRKISQGIATYAHQQGNWSFDIVQDPYENIPYLTCDPLESPITSGKWHADGIIAYCPSRKAAHAIHKLKVPIVGIELEYGRCDPKWRIPYFATDNEAIGRLAAEEFLRRGLKHLAFCGIPATHLTGWSERRQAAFQTCATEAGAACSIFPAIPTTRAKKSQQEQLSQWLASLEKPVGVMACYDVRARHVLTTCRKLGILVPEEVAVIGVDNDELMCELSTPPLSSIEQGARGIGHQAAVLLDRLMAGRKAERLRTVVQPEGIVTRRSSDALAIDDPDVAAAFRFIGEHACQGIRAGDVVNAVAISRTALMSRFKTILGRTIHDEIRRVQIARVRQLMAATDLPLNLVAMQSGFRYLQQMIAAFRRHTGQTPGEYRSQSRQG